MYQDFKCQETYGNFVRDNITKLNQVQGINQEVLIKNVSRYLYFLKPEKYKNINFNGRQAKKVMTMFGYPEDLLDLRVGDRFRFNLTNHHQKIPFDPNLKPFAYNPNQRDIFELEIHSITPYATFCQKHIEIVLVSYN